MFSRYSRTKNRLSRPQKKNVQKVEKIDIFPKGLTHGFVPPMAIFPTFFSGNIGQEKYRTRTKMRVRYSRNFSRLQKKRTCSLATPAKTFTHQQQYKNLSLRCNEIINWTGEKFKKKRASMSSGPKHVIAFGS